MAEKKEDKEVEVTGHFIGRDNNPPRLTDRQEELCRRLDEFNRVALNKEDWKPSEVFRGALYSMEPMHQKQNPDWMAQSAHSLRDILYPFFKSGADIKGQKALIQYGSAGKPDQLSATIGQYYGFFSEVAHHNLIRAATNPIISGSKKSPVPITQEAFIIATAGFEDVLFEALRRQIDVHREIDELIIKDTRDSVALNKLIALNNDARRYFYSKANEEWLDWLWENGFLDLTKVAPDPAGYSYQSPELDYLTRAAALVPSRVVDILLLVPIRPESFIPEVVDRFFWICQGLPPQQLARVVYKIRDEKWVCLMEKHNRWGFDYERMLKTLADAKDCQNLIILAEALLAVRPKEPQLKKAKEIIPDNPFFYNEIADSKIFEELAAIDEDYVELALKLAVQTLADIIRLGDAVKDDTFDIDDDYFLIDVDLFSIELGEERQFSYQRHIHNLAAAVKRLTQRSIGTKCDKADVAKRIYEKYLRPLPNSQFLYRLKLFSLSLCPYVFRDELRAAYFKILDGEEPWPLIRGAEFEWAIIQGFPTLSDEDQRAFVSGLISRYGDKDNEEWKVNYGWRLLSCAYKALNLEEAAEARKVFGRELDPDYSPRPSISGIQGGFVNAKAPIQQEELSRMAISFLVEKLKGEWAPEQLRIQDTAQDFLRPLNAEGMGNAIRADIIKRPGDYISNARLFFDRDYLDSHYTYTLLAEFHDILHTKKNPPGVDWSSLVTLLREIIESANAREFQRGRRERERGDTWLVGWDGVHRAIADVLIELLTESGSDRSIFFTAFRDVLLDILAYLLSYSDPEPETELHTIETVERDPQTGTDIRTGSDPLTTAINSVRGGAFRAFVNFVEKDELSIPKSSPTRLSSDVKEIYQKCLDAEKTLAIRFLFGHYLAFFYYRDRVWLRGIFPQLFSDDATTSDLNIAAWEGYLAGQFIYKELFEELAEYYRRAIRLNPTQYTPRRYHMDLDKGLATHMAFAFIHYPEFDFGSELFILFWSTDNAKRKKEFISFIGRSCLSRVDAAKWVESHNINIDKLKRFWDWALEYCGDPEILMGFSYWVMTEGGILSPEWLAKHIRLTLEITKGNVEWNNGILHSLPVLAENAPLDTIKALRLYILGDQGLLRHRPWLYLDDELMRVFRTLYNNPLTEKETFRLINDLLPIGSGQFWKLKEVISP